MQAALGVSPQGVGYKRAVPPQQADLRVSPRRLKMEKRVVQPHILILILEMVTVLVTVTVMEMSMEKRAVSPLFLRYRRRRG